MTADTGRWQRLRAIFDELVELPAHQQDARLADLTLDDPGLRTEIKSLLVADRAAGDRFEHAPELPDDPSPEGPEPLPGGTRIGPYRVSREVGRGGMGAVYEAFRDDDAFTKRVAIKMVPSGRDSELILRRFRQERQILARLDHKNIAALLDGGMTGDGRPYFAMEFVEGERIDRYCGRHQLGIRERLQLMRQVCAAVHYAHQHLVVHRDLKPSNIMVGPDGTVKLLDFGIAKLVDPVETGEELTDTGGLPMTTGYASPEQLLGDPVNTATDVYSLGVVLYELLAGRQPFQFADLPILEIHRRMLVENPPPPSVAAAAESAAMSRLPRGRAGELDHIVLQALRKEPARRYASAEQLAEDLLRFLDGRPVLAQPDSLGYRVRKFAARNRAAVGAVTVVFLTLLGGLAVTLWQYEIGRRERAKTEVVNRFLQDLLVSSGSGAADPQTAQRTVRDVLDAATQRLETENLSANPGVKATLQQIIGSSYVNLGQYALGERNLRAALVTQTRLFGADSPELLKTLYSLAQVALIKADYPSAEAFFERRVQLLRREQASGRIPVDLLITALSDFAVLRRARGDSKAAETLLREGFELAPQLPSDLQSSFRQAETLLALTWLDQGKFGEAEEYARRLVTGFRAQPNPESSALCSGLTLLGSILMEQGKLAEAESTLKEAEAMYRRLYDANYAPIYDNLRLQAQVYYLAGRLDEGDAAIERTIAKYRENSGSRYVNFATALTIKGLILNRKGRVSEAEAVLREAARLRAEHLPDEHFMSALTKGALGEALHTQKRYAEAEPFLLASYQTLKRTQVTENQRVVFARQRLTALYTAWNRPDLLARVR